MLLLHTSTGPIVLLYNSNSPCVATTHSCVATTHSLCGFHTETGVRVRVRVRAALWDIITLVIVIPPQRGEAILGACV